jgi:hypothetical protein
MAEERKKTLGEYFVKFRFLIIGVVGALTVLFTYGVTQKLSIQVVLEEMVPPKHPFVKLHQEYAEQYGGTSTVVMALAVKKGDIFNVETLEKIKWLNDELRFHPDVRRAFVYSIAQRKSKVVKGHAGGTVDVSALMWPEIDKTPAGIERLKKNLFSSDLYNGILISEDGKAAMIMADCWDDIDYAKFFDFIQGLKQKTEDENISIHVAGRPMLLGWIFHFMPKLYLIFALTAAFIVVAVASHFKNLVVIIPLMALGLSAVWGFGLISLLGINFNPLMVVLAVLVAARAHSHSVQTTRRFLEELHVCGGDRKKATAATIDGIFLASLAAIVTDAAGFSVLIMARIPMVQRIAILCSFWVVSILLISSVIGPILCIYMPIPKNLKEYDFSWDKGPGQGRTVPTSWMGSIANLCLGRSSTISIVVIMILTGLLAAYLATNLKVGDTNPGSPILWPDSTYNQDCKVINEKFDNAGTDLINIIVEGDKDMAVEQPEVMKRIDLYGRFIKHKHPDVVAGTQSLPKIVKTLNKEFHEGDPRFLSIPDNLQLTGNLMFFYQTAGDPSDCVAFFDPHYRHTVIRVFLKDHQGDTLRKVIDSTREFFESQPPIEGIKFRYAAGYGGILAGTNEEIVWSQTGTLFLIFLTVFVFCGIAYRSVVAAVLLCIPLLVANLVAFAFMAIRNIGLDINSLPVSAVGIGVGVDYGIYMLSRMEEEFKNTGGDWKVMTHTSLNSAGKGVFITAITVIVPVLLWPIMADMKFQAEMGLLLAFIMFFDMLGALFFLPAAVNLLKPKFMLRHAHIKMVGRQVVADTQTGASSTIFEAVKYGDRKAVHKFIAAGMDLNAAFEDGRTALMEAMRIIDHNSRTGITKALLAAGADVNAKDRDHNSALHLASGYGFEETARILLKARANANEGASIADKPIGRAIEAGNIKIIELLMDGGAGVDAETVKYAAQYGGSGRPETIEMILRLFVNWGVDLNIKDKQGRTALEYIKSLSGLERTVKMLEKLGAKST